jgi:cellulose synthase/poly-beta-1,6-N-acetylglucosamine synthase-like glycosyltransferase
MFNVFVVIFIVSVYCVIHTYLLYPFVMITAFKTPRKVFNSFVANDFDLPHITILIAAYNEANVIEKKILSVFQNHYPPEKINILVGSDASNDGTDGIVEKLMMQIPQLKLVAFKGRSGKINIINHLQTLVKDPIIILTDANVMFSKNTIYELVKNFRDERVGLVAANIIKVSHCEKEITFQEKKYLSLENSLKAAESNAWGIIMGAEGGCYAIRNTLYFKVPSHFNVDDFFITMKVIQQNKKTLFSKSAICFEDISGEAKGEYKRKIRISTGNFQNLAHFKKSLTVFIKPLAFAFWSHKVLRWLSPFFLILALISSCILSLHNSFFFIIFICQFFGILLPLINNLLKFQNSAIKFASHFYLMNFALLQGFFKYLLGVHSSIWEPVKRDA